MASKRLKSGLIILDQGALFAIGPHGGDTALYYAGGTVVLRGEKPEDVAKELRVSPPADAQPAAPPDQAAS